MEPPKTFVQFERMTFGERRSQFKEIITVQTTKLNMIL